MTDMERRSVVVTGVGVVSAAGVGANDFWKGLGVAPPAGPREVPSWDPEPWIPKREHRRMDRFTQFALVAAMEALDQSGGLEHVDPTRVTVGVATGIGGLPSLEELIQEAYTAEPRPSPMLIPMMMCNAAAATISIHYGFGGQATTPVVACAAGGQAIIDTVRQIQWGYADAGIAGGAEGAVREPTMAGFRSARALSPSMVARPFDADRDGFVLGEGAGILVLEEKEAALARGVPILAEILGGAATADAHHITAPHPEGTGAERAVRLALTDAGIAVDAVSYVNAHGTGTDLNDRTEGEVIARVWPDRQPAVSSIKGTTGHALGASGAIEAVASVLAIERGELPPNVGLASRDPDIPLTDIVETFRRTTVGAVVSNSFGFGGHNTALVLGRGH
jgi:3-oxoacyl-[acyl-carrier-protein] synthase II